MQIRKASIKDIESVVVIHCNAFNGFFLTSLGGDFLRFYYSVFVKSNETIMLVVEEKGKVIGFSAATMNCKGFNSRLIKSNLFAFGRLSLKLQFKNPKAFLRLVRNLTKKSSEVEDNEEYAELYSIGVDKNQQGRGIGKILLGKTEAILRQMGVDRVSLTTDYDNNESAVSFYHSMGYETLYEFVAYPNRKMYRFIKSL